MRLDAGATPWTRSTWALRVAMEYRSAAVSSQMLHWALQLGLDNGIVDRLHQLVADELDHVELSRRVHTAAGGLPEDVRVDRDLLAFGYPSDLPLERRALTAALQEFALHESMALEAFLCMRRAPLVPVVRRCIEPICRDEARHRRLGWALLDALLARTGAQDWLRERTRPALQIIEEVYQGQACPTEGERAWGLLSDQDYKKVTARARKNIEGQLIQRALL